jgi:outer membrane protein assembly factor BamB
VDCEIRSCDVQETSGAGVITMNWHGPVKRGEHRIAFYLLGQTSSNAPGALASARLAQNAAAFALPRPALAVVGEYGQVKGELVVLATDHLFGHALTSAGIETRLVSSAEPVDLDWDFRSGTMHVAARKPTTLRLALSATDKLHVNGEPASAPSEGRDFSIALPQGRHVLTGAPPSVGIGSELVARLARQTAAARQTGVARPESSTGVASSSSSADHALRKASGRATQAAELPVAFATKVGGSVADMIAVSRPEGTQLFVAQGSTIHVLGQDGKEVRQLQTDGKIRVLRWWEAPKLLLAGCVDEQVIAFDATGKRQWVFVSQMDPAVYEAAKTYWFKSAPGHEGIHGLHTGEFDQGKNRCFVGSACTLEILDERGTLVKRTPIFWGPCWKFLLVPGRGDSRNLLVSQWHNGSDDLVIVNSKRLADSGRGYYGVPAGQAFVGGWDCQNRTALLHEDLDGDGKKEIATAINGTWNRVTVYAEDGRPLANAQFGPGASSVPRAQMRDMDVADLNGDGKKELVVGISEGPVVALSHDCKKVWSTRLPSPPLSLRCVTPSAAKLPRIIVGCDDGTVAVLDSNGVLLRRAKISGRPTHVQILQATAGPLAVLATDRGDIQGFKL